jgi:2-iminobutanoate/2-iminopropanoate deaminase
MQLTPLISSLAPKAAGGYAQALQVTGATKILFISRQVPESVDGTVPPDFEQQAALVWYNVLAQLHAAGMSVSNLLKVTTFLSAREYAQPNREARQKALGDHSPALTVIITGIFDEKWLLEIEAVAAE